MISTSKADEDAPSGQGFRSTLRGAWARDERGALTCRWQVELALFPPDPEPVIHEPSD